MSAWRHPRPAWRAAASWGVALMAVSGAMLLCFQHVVAHWRECSGMFDVLTYFGPQAFYLDYSLSRGEFPLWNPLTYCGLPYAANPQVAAFYPPNLIRALWASAATPNATNVSMLWLTGFHLLVAGVSTFFFARAHGLSRPAACVAAFAYALSGSFVRRACALQFVAVMAWLPLVLLLLRGAFTATRRARKLTYALLAGLTLSLLVLGGFAQIVVYAGVVIGAYWVLFRLFHLQEGQVAKAPGALRNLGNDVAVILVFGTAGAVLSAAMLVPAAQYAGYSNRMQGAGDEEDVGRNVVSPALLAEWLVCYGGAENIRDSIRASGLGVLLLALGACWHKRRRDAAVFLLLFIIALDCSLGPPFPVSRLVYALTPFHLVIPSRAFIAACLPLAMLAGFGVDALTEKYASPRWRALRTAMLLIIGLPLLALLAHWTSPHRYLPVSPIVAAIPAALLGAAIVGGWPGPTACWRAAIAALVLAEIAAWSRPYAEHLATSRRGGTMDYGRTTPAPWMDNRRGADPHPNMWLYDQRPAMNGYDPLYIGAVRQVVCAPYVEDVYKRGLSDEAATMRNGRGWQLLKRPFWLVRQCVEGQLPAKSALFPPATTAFVAEAEGLPVPAVERRDVLGSTVSPDTAATPLLDGAPAVLGRPGGGGQARQLLRLGPVHDPRHSALELAYTSTGTLQTEVSFQGLPHMRRPQGPGVTLHRTEPGEERSIQIPLPDERPLYVILRARTGGANAKAVFSKAAALADKHDEDALIEIVYRSANRVTLRVGPLSGYRLLVFLDGYYPGWQASVDGKYAKLHRVDDAFKAVALSPGVHDVEFVFRPLTVYLGVGISLTSLALILFVLCAARRRMHRAGFDRATGLALPERAPHGAEPGDAPEIQPEAEAEEPPEEQFEED